MAVSRGYTNFSDRIPLRPTSGYPSGYPCNQYPDNPMCILCKSDRLPADLSANVFSFQAANIAANVQIHPNCADGDDGDGGLTLDWTSMPRQVHPATGGLPVTRVERKCQQLENLATAVCSIAKPGDTIVDFCSGGVSKQPQLGVNRNCHRSADRRQGSKFTVSRGYQIIRIPDASISIPEGYQII